MRSLARMHEIGRRAGGGERGGDLAGDVATLAHAADDDSPGDGREPVDGIEVEVDLVDEHDGVVGFRHSMVAQFLLERSQPADLRRIHSRIGVVLEEIGRAHTVPLTASEIASERREELMEKLREELREDLRALFAKSETMVVYATTEPAESSTA